MRILMICCILVLGFVAVPAEAQLSPSSAQGTDPVFSFSPQYPEPGDEVTATIIYHGNTQYGSTLTWVVDGEILPNSKNLRVVTFTAGESGLPQSVNVIFTSPTGEREISSAIITPMFLDVIIDSQTHVPEFYLGRSLPSVGSKVVATALISKGGDIVNPDFMYKWEINRTVLEQGPIRGKNVMEFEMPIGESAILTLTISELVDPATGQTPGKTIAKRLIKISSVNPKLLFYEVNTLLGISQKPISKSLSLVGDSGTIRAEPFNLDSRVYNNPDVHVWKVNDTESPSSNRANPYEVMIEKTGTTGRTYLEFHVRDTKQVLQGVEDSILINL